MRDENMKAGQELDALIAEKVMGLDLRIPRWRALSLVGATYTSVTGPAFELRTGDVVGIPDDLPVLPGDASGNERYFRYVAEWLIAEADDPKVRAAVARAVDEVRNTPRPYSTDIAAAWEVVERLRALSDTISYAFDLRDNSEHRGPPQWLARFDRYHLTDEYDGSGGYWRADTAPLAICLAALKAVGGEVPRG